MSHPRKLTARARHHLTCGKFRPRLERLEGRDVPGETLNSVMSGLELGTPALAASLTGLDNDPVFAALPAERTPGDAGPDQPLPAIDGSPRNTVGGVASGIGMAYAVRDDNATAGGEHMTDRARTAASPIDDNPIVGDGVFWDLESMD